MALSNKPQIVKKMNMQVAQKYWRSNCCNFRVWELTLKHNTMQGMPRLAFVLKSTSI